MCCRASTAAIIRRCGLSKSVGRFLPLFHALINIVVVIFLSPVKEKGETWWMAALWLIQQHTVFTRLATTEYKLSVAARTPTEGPVAFSLPRLQNLRLASSLIIYAVTHALLQSSCRNPNYTRLNIGTRLLREHMLLCPFHTMSKSLYTNLSKLKVPYWKTALFSATTRGDRDCPAY